MSKFVFIEATAKEEDGRVIGKTRIKIEKDKMMSSLKKVKEALKEGQEATHVEDIEWEGNHYHKDCDHSEDKKPKEKKKGKTWNEMMNE